MTTIHLTDAQRDTFTACGLIIIDGCQCGPYYPPGHPFHICHCGFEGWRILTEPCDTCGGTGLRIASNGPPPTPGYVMGNCRDCVGGRRVVTLTATCPTCLARAEWCGYGDGLPDDNPLCSAGVVTLGRFTIPALLPVYAEGDIHWTGGPQVILKNEPHPTTGDRLLLLTWQSEFGTPLTVDPLPRPGQFIARPERVA